MMTLGVISLAFVVLTPVATWLVSRMVFRTDDDAKRPDNVPPAHGRDRRPPAE
jgi:hypothetical protein